MLINVDLMNLLGATEIEMDGEKGIFIPVRFNCHSSKRKSGYRGACVSISLNRSRLKKKYDWYGIQILPAGIRDRALDTPELCPRSKTVAWGFEAKNFSSKFNPDEFNRIVGGGKKGGKE